MRRGPQNTCCASAHTVTWCVAYDVESTDAPCSRRTPPLPDARNLTHHVTRSDKTHRACVQRLSRLIQGKPTRKTHARLSEMGGSSTWSWPLDPRLDATKALPTSTLVSAPGFHSFVQDGFAGSWQRCQGQQPYPGRQIHGRYSDCMLDPGLC